MTLIKKNQWIPLKCILAVHSHKFTSIDIYVDWLFVFVWRQRDSHECGSIIIHIYIPFPFVPNSWECHRNCWNAWITYCYGCKHELGGICGRDPNLVIDVKYYISDQTNKQTYNHQHKMHEIHVEQNTIQMYTGKGGKGKNGE